MSDFAMKSYLTTVLNERMRHFSGSKHTATSPTFFFLVLRPHPHDLRPCKLCDLYWNWRNMTCKWSFQLGGHRICHWCGSSFSTPIPSLKFVDLPIPKIWPIFGHDVNQHGDLDLWVLTFRPLNGVTGLPVKFQLPKSFCSRLWGQARVRH